MEYATSLKAVMVEGHGPVTGLLYAVYSASVDESKEGYARYQLLKLGGGASLKGRCSLWCSLLRE